MERLESTWLKFGKILKKNTFKLSKTKLMHASQSQKEIQIPFRKLFFLGEAHRNDPHGPELVFSVGMGRVEEAHRDVDEVIQDGTGHPGSCSQLGNLYLFKLEQLFRRMLQLSLGIFPRTRSPASAWNSLQDDCRNFKPCLER